VDNDGTKDEPVYNCFMLVDVGFADVRNIPGIMALVRSLISSSLWPGLGNNSLAYSAYDTAPMPAFR
jgi:hypothetical protein